MPAPTTLDFARLSEAVYSTTARTVAGFARASDMTSWSAFQGCLFSRAGAGGGTDLVAAFAGTDPNQLGDILADVGFGGGLPAAIPILGPVLAAVGQIYLADQVRGALTIVRMAQQRATGANDSVFVTGHSLGGGLGQIAAAISGTRGVCFSAPAVTAVAGIGIIHTIRPTPIVCFKVDNDPINATGAVGRWLGKVVRIRTSRTGGAAHSISGTVADLAGPLAAMGGADPFTL
jgi:hypothetical protein